MELGKNQFLFTTKRLDESCFFQTIKIGEYSLYLGPDCRVIHEISEDREIWFIGYLTDVLYGSRSEKTIVKDIFADLASKGSLSFATDMVGGRWVCFYKFEDCIYVWNDACALKQVFYDSSFENDTICVASQARYVAFVTERLKHQAAEEYFEVAKQNKEFSFPLDSTVYHSIKRLLPNHYLSGKPFGVFRMSMKGPLGAFDYTEENKSRIGVWLANGTKSAAGNWRLAVTITGGLDSRLALASCRNVKESICAITMKYLNMSSNHYDLKTSADYCEHFGVKHEIILCNNANMSFEDKYRRHSEHAHDYWMQMGQCIEENGFCDHLLVKGSCNEVCQASSGVLPNKFVTAHTLCKLFDIPYTRFSKSIIDEWLVAAECVSDDIDLLTLFYWEHRMGSWLAECLNESDCVCETFTPFNVRGILLAVNMFPIKNRIAPHFKFYYELLEYMDHGSTSVPINQGRYKSLFSNIKLFVKYRAHFLYNLYIRMMK